MDFYKINYVLENFDEFDNSFNIFEHVFKNTYDSGIYFFRKYY